MADVQQERGHVRIANRLDEAIICAPFSGTQLKIVHCVIRLTWGWRQHTVVISASDLAKRCGLKDTGGFRRELAQLIRQNVITEVAKGHGRTPSAYSINKNFEQWREYSVPLDRLVALFGERPPSLDSAPRMSQATESGDNTALSDSAPQSGQSNDNANPSPLGQTNTDDARLSASTEQVVCLNRGTLTGSKSLNDETLQRPTTITTSSISVSTDHFTIPTTNSAADENCEQEAVGIGGDQIDRDESGKSASEPPTNPPDNSAEGEEQGAPLSAGQAVSHARVSTDATPSDEVHRYAVRLATAANSGIEYRWGAQPNVVGFRTGYNLAADCLKAGVPLELAREAIVTSCHVSKKPAPPATIEWFRNAVFRAHEEAQQRAFNAADSSPASRTPSAPAPMASIVNAKLATLEQQQSRDEHALGVTYDAEARAAGIAWGKDASNRADYATIAERVMAKYATVAENPFRQKAIATEIIAECAKRAGFPDFATWCAVRAAGAGAA